MICISEGFAFDYFVDGSLVYFTPLKSANFYNCLIDGSLENEMTFVKKDDAGFNVEFNLT